jgi:uncharacterized protein YbcI
MPDVPSDPASELIAAADDEAREQRGTMRAALANAMVGMKKKYYGLGPTAARAWLLDDYVFVALEGGLTRNEQTLLDDGKQDIVRAYRLAFQETVRAPLTAAVAEIVGREVLDYHSQIVFDPPRTFEIFVLGAALPR